MPNLGPDYDLAVRFQSAEDAIRRMQANPLGTNFSQSQSDGTVGFELFQDPDSGGTALGFRHGPNSPFTDSTTVPGTTQHPRFLYMGQLDSTKLPVSAVVDTDAGFVLLRASGVPILIVTDSGGIQVFDKGGNLVLGTDEVSGGISTAVYYPTPQSTSPGLVPQTANTASVGVASSSFINYSPRIHWDAIADMNGGGAGGGCSLGLTNLATGAVVNGVQHNNVSTFLNVGETITLDESWIGVSVLATVYASSATLGTPFYVSPLGLYGIGSQQTVFSVNG